MNIVVCLKQVPETTSVKINPETNTLIREGIANVVNPFDSYALEAAVCLCEKHGGQVTAISMGPPQAETILRDAVACGADRSILVSDRAFAGADTLATARALAAAIGKLAPIDLVITGRQTVDGDTGQVGPEIAEMLGRPFVGYVSEIQDATDGTMRLRRMLEDGYELREVPLPAVISVVKEVGTPRLPSLRGQLKAKKADIAVWALAELDLDASVVGLDGSATKVVKIFFPQRESQAEMLQGTPDEQAQGLVAHLEKQHLI